MRDLILGLLCSLFIPSRVFADGIAGGVPYLGTMSSSPGDYKGAPNPPFLGPLTPPQIIGKCFVYQDAKDSIGYPCPRLTVSLYDSDNHFVASVQTRPNGSFSFAVDADRTYLLRVQSNKYEVRKNFDFRVRAGQIFLPLQKVVLPP